jgi:hypothetical protein
MLNGILATRGEAHRRKPILRSMLIGLLAIPMALPAAETGQEVEQLIGRAERAIEANRLTTPTADNAVAYIERALALEPGDSRAAALLEQVVGRYEQLVDRALDRGEQARLRSLERAITFRDRANRVIAKHGLSSNAVASMDESIAALGKPAASGDEPAGSVSTDEMLKALVAQHVALASTFLDENNVPEARWHAAQANALADRYQLAAEGLPELRHRLAEADKSRGAVTKASARAEPKDISREHLTELAAFYVASENAALAHGDISAAVNHRRAAEDLVALYGLSEEEVRNASGNFSLTAGSHV